MQKIVGPIAVLAMCVSSSAGGIELGLPNLDFEQKIAELNTMYDSSAAEQHYGIQRPGDGVSTQHRFPLQIKGLNADRESLPIFLVEDTEDVWRFYEELLRRKNQKSV